MNTSASSTRLDRAISSLSYSPDSNPGRVVGLDNHPDLFSAGIIEGHHALNARVVGGCDRQPIGTLEQWAHQHLTKEEVRELGYDTKKEFAEFLLQTHAIENLT